MCSVDRPQASHTLVWWFWWKRLSTTLSGRSLRHGAWSCAPSSGSSHLEGHHPSRTVLQGEREECEVTLGTAGLAHPRNQSVIRISAFPQVHKDRRALEGSRDRLGYRRLPSAHLGIGIPALTSSVVLGNLIKLAKLQFSHP